MKCEFCMKDVKVFPKVNGPHLSLYCAECKNFIKHANAQERAKLEAAQRVRIQAASVKTQTVITGQTVHETAKDQEAVFKQVPTYADIFRKLSDEEIARMFGDVAKQVANLLKNQSLTPEQVGEQIRVSTLAMLKKTNQ